MKYENEIQVEVTASGLQFHVSTWYGDLEAAEEIVRTFTSHGGRVRSAWQASDPPADEPLRPQGPALLCIVEAAFAFGMDLNYLKTDDKFLLTLKKGGWNSPLIDNIVECIRMPEREWIMYKDPESSETERKFIETDIHPLLWRLLDHINVHPGDRFTAKLQRVCK
jgi:hypothetical protein